MWRHGFIQDAVKKFPKSPSVLSDPLPRWDGIVFFDAFSVNANTNMPTRMIRTSKKELQNAGSTIAISDPLI
ncbi:hypothetical protein A2778_05335 [Candidatus Daviesbacteria bacterium RIFCSPHIGHO2_01_FULL_40_24]|nr:MAG: hypothetical protein A2778_05335 [Candidatus Daviesbacteria bacterium RIFCSPHIGHO2_01_FULL_40_24]OGE29073.1 MAG: hypothetical protein A3C29_06865 [Candidatus Daviesbacteria bacterium RIFCSPHIGHO2_02_FULL_40_16]OGE43589.1 MAG: hypothetical protein A3A53_03075 [Candidatus Daviesbacteria bacterium RIFCSPLOWO2_01_FULL_39_23]OGE67862.1 MAG: hypothetical protein A3J16_02965 [Candidatus Daviesbacteria bacterium RIFCSPLOWO2_02_FULL_39_13]